MMAQTRGLSFRMSEPNETTPATPLVDSVIASLGRKQVAEKLQTEPGA